MARRKITISVPGPILPGTLTFAKTTCGKKNCACSSNPRKLHGPYCRWSGLIDGKHVTIAIPPRLIRECKLRNSRYRRLIQKYDKIMADALKNAPWVKHLI